MFSHVSHLLIEEYEADSYYDEQCNDESPSQQLSVFRYLLESVFCDSKRRPTVTDFQIIPDTEDFLVGALLHMADVMSSRTSCGHFTCDPYTQYVGLRSLAISLRASTVSLYDPNVDLRMIIERQTALHALCLDDFTAPVDGSPEAEPVAATSASPEHDQLMHSFGSLFWDPTFFRLLFSFTFLHSSGNNTCSFKYNFLSSPVRGQELELCGVRDVSDAVVDLALALASS